MGERPRIEDLTDEDRAGDLNNPMTSPNPYDRHNASVESRRSDEARGARYRPIRSRVILQRLQKAKQENETIKFKSSYSQSSLEGTFIVVNSKSESSGYKVQIVKKSSRECEHFLKISGKELCKHIMWTMLNIFRVPDNSYLLQKVSLTDSEFFSVG